MDNLKGITMTLRVRATSDPGPLLAYTESQLGHPLKGRVGGSFHEEPSAGLAPFLVDREFAFHTNREMSACQTGKALGVDKGGVWVFTDEFCKASQNPDNSEIRVESGQGLWDISDPSEGCIIQNASQLLEETIAEELIELLLACLPLLQLAGGKKRPESCRRGSETGFQMSGPGIQKVVNKTHCSHGGAYILQGRSPLSVQPTDNSAPAGMVGSGGISQAVILLGSPGPSSPRDIPLLLGQATCSPAGKSCADLVAKASYVVCLGLLPSLQPTPLVEAGQQWPASWGERMWIGSEKKTSGAGAQEEWILVASVFYRAYRLDLELFGDKNLQVAAIPCSANKHGAGTPAEWEMLSLLPWTRFTVQENERLSLTPGIISGSKRKKGIGNGTPPRATLTKAPSPVVIFGAGFQGLVPAVRVATAARGRLGPRLGRESGSAGPPGLPQAKDSQLGPGLGWARLASNMTGAWPTIAPPPSPGGRKLCTPKLLVACSFLSAGTQDGLIF
ncbi:hypothetical protein P7K49_003486 [Saguinus oedipus]|uniref:Uncharacterized protein n=1 Tax=Saguinus oedipus TaxID=9490 RepID=A0ABQ9W4N4_SAGOE|nr:hypothetical protein P7K49_003486 [Saguinus oedipus]